MTCVDSAACDALPRLQLLVLRSVSNVYACTCCLCFVYVLPLAHVSSSSLSDLKNKGLKLRGSPVSQSVTMAPTVIDNDLFHYDPDIESTTSGVYAHPSCE